MSEKLSQQNTLTHKTAKVRTRVSVPVRNLFNMNLLQGDILDFGCGHGFDADYYGFDKYDPYWFPEKPTKKYDVVYAGYVLNVLREDEPVLQDIVSYLKPRGVAYIVVRRDLTKEGFTSMGTFQRNVVLNFPVVYEAKNRYCIYELTNQS